jgi:hypothetical protein
MYFNILADIGTEIHGYLIPDGFSSKPHIMVLAGGETYGPIECDVYLEGPHRLKHHETGLVGFTLTPQIITNLNEETSVEISDEQTGFTFYRRLNPELHIQKRVFRLETQFAPHSELDRSLKRYFQFYANEVEHYGSETVRQMLEIINQPSTYVSGRVILRGVQQYFDDETVKITSLRDPFYELAIRLSTIAKYKQYPFNFVSKRDEIIFEPAMIYFADTNFTDDTSLIQKIENAPKDVLELFESPFTKQLVATNPNDDVQRDSISSALDILSQFTICEPDEEDEHITNDISDILTIEKENISFKPKQECFVSTSKILKNLPLVEHLLENDLILFHFVKKSKEKISRN